MSRAISIILFFMVVTIFPLPVLGDSEVQVNGILRLNPGGSIIFPDGTSQVTATIPVIHTSAVCASASANQNGTCSCSGQYVTHITLVYGSCTVTSDTGGCTANGTSNHSAECCVCKP